MKRFECTHVMPGCEGVVEADSVDEVLRQVVRHAADAHSMTELDDEIVAKVRAGITEA